MADFSNLTTTNAGKALISGDLAGHSLRFTMMQAGDGTIPDVSHIPSLTSLIDPRANLPITALTDNRDGTVTLTAVISSANVPTGFDFRELGILASLDGAAATLFCYSNAFDNTDYIPSRGESAQVINSCTVTIIVDTNADITIVLGDSSQITAENIGPPSVGPGWYAQKVGTVLQFKRLVQGVNIDLIETPSTITISERMLDRDTNLFVNPSFTNVSPNFSTIPNAVAYLKQYRLSANINVNINVSGDTYNHTGPITIDHLDAAQIRIFGATRRAVAVSAVTNVSPLYKIATVASNTGLRVGQIVYLHGWSLLNPWRGSTVITEINGNNITLYKGYAGNIDFGTNQGGLTDVNLFWFPSFIFGNGFYLPYGIGYLTDFTIDSGTSANGTTAGILCRGGIANVANILTYDNYCGIGCANSSMKLYGDIVLGIGKWGLEVDQGGSVEMGTGSLIINGQTVAGIAIQNGGQAMVGINEASQTGFVALVGNNYGGHMWNSSILEIGNCWYSINLVGFNALIGAVISAGLVNTPVSIMVPQNNWADLVAGDGAFIGYSRCSGPVPSTNPAANTVGNSNSFIRVSP